jgi:hypothetical protein
MKDPMELVLAVLTLACGFVLGVAFGVVMMMASR